MSEISDEEWHRDHADRNSAGCYAVAIDALRERLERSRVVIGNCTLYNEDCAFILPHTGCVDALVTDPPYGLGIAAKGSIGGGGWNMLQAIGTMTRSIPI